MKRFILALLVLISAGASAQNFSITDYVEQQYGVSKAYRITQTTTITPTPAPSFQRVSGVQVNNTVYNSNTQKTETLPVPVPVYTPVQPTVINVYQSPVPLNTAPTYRAPRIDFSTNGVQLSTPTVIQRR